MRFLAGPASLRRLATVVLLAAAGAGICGCGGGSQAKLEAARHQLDRGRLDRALAILEDADGPEAQALRARVAARRDVRAAALNALEDFRRSRGERELPELLAELRRMVAGQDDPVIEEWIRQEMSTTTDWIAERNASRPRESGKTADATPDGNLAEEGVDPLTRLQLEGLERARAEGRWSEALEAIDRLAPEVPELANLLKSRRELVLEAASTDATALVASAAVAEREAGLEPAWKVLNEALVRFPAPGGDDGSIAALHAAERDYRERLEAARADARSEVVLSAVDSVPVVEGPVVEEPADPAAEAHRAEEAGELARAAELWRVSAAQAGDGQEREVREHRAWVLERRMDLWRDLADPGIDRTVLEPADVAALVESRELTAGAAIGSCLERLRPSAHPATEEVHEAALDDLADLVAEGHLPEATSWRILAEYRREPMPLGGYRYVRGNWMSRAEQEEASLLRRIERAVKDVASADAARREEITAELSDLVGDSGAAIAGLAGLAELLRLRAEAAVSRMNLGRTWRKVGEVARAREELDRLRAKALSLVADENRYFYPYNPPADPSRSYADYVSVQREVSTAIDAVRELWEQDPAAQLPADFREAAGVLEFVLAQPAEWRGAFELPADWPAWFAGVDLTADSVHLQTFAWTGVERDALRMDEAVIALSGERWEAAGDDGPDIEERRAQELTNDYRRMLGRRALAWDARLFTASEWHSAYMAETGNFGHGEPDRAGRVTLFDRMKSAGYDEGWNENCQAGTEWARRAFASWQASSEHHRNLLSDVPREVAVARVGTYWTMNFGRGNEFEDDLDPWRD